MKFWEMITLKLALPEQIQQGWVLVQRDPENEKK